MAEETDPQSEAKSLEDEQKAKVARAVGAVGAASLGYWLGKELFEEELAEVDGEQKLVYFKGQAGEPPDLWLGATDVSAGDGVRVSGPIKKVALHHPRDSKKLGLERPAKGYFTSVVVEAGGHDLPFFFKGDLRDRFKKGELTTIYTGVLGKDAYGRPSERLALGHRGGQDLLTADNLSAPVQWEPMVMAVGMGLAVLKGGQKNKK